MTGLDLSVDALIEIGVVITNQELQILDEGFEVVIKPPMVALSQMSDFVRKMHEDSGLLQVLDAGESLSQAEVLILNYLERMQVPAAKCPLGGNSPWMDRSFIARDMPKLNQFLHYRTIDVSSIKELAKRWYPTAYFKAPEKTGNHRALSDAKDSIRELTYYRSEIFIESKVPNQGS